MPAICKGGSPIVLGGTDGVFLPWAHIESQALGAILYLVGLLWCFQGVGIIADTFMCAIEKITSSKKRVKRGGKEVTVNVWNRTVANLTLMALGSSAPEILLSLIELCLTEEMHSGALGPSTIVGSAAFNLLIITAVCVSSIPEGEQRKIADVSVFGVTAFFSVFAYLWLLFILMAPPSPHVVTIWEGVLTFLFFPLLVSIAYLADIGWFHRRLGKTKKGRLVFTPGSTKEEYDEMMARIHEKYGRTPQDPAKREVLLRYEFGPDATRAVRRVAATRTLAGSGSHLAHDGKWYLGEVVAQHLNPTQAARGQSSKTNSWVTVRTEPEDQSLPKSKAIFNIGASAYAISEAQKEARIQVIRTGNIDEQVTCKYQTRSGTAIEGEDFVRATGRLEFGPTETEKTFDINILEDKTPEDTEEFYVDILSASELAIVGEVNCATVVVLDSDGPGQLSFEKDEVTVPAATEKMCIMVNVTRKFGAFGCVSCSYHTEDDSAKAGTDYNSVEGKLEFEAGKLTASFPIEILPCKLSDKKVERFRVILYEPRGGATFDANCDGGAEQNILTVTIEADPDGRKKYSMVMGMANAADLVGLVNWDNVAIGKTRWKEQFAQAIYVGGAKEDQADATVLDWAFHVVGLPWKVLFAVVPPTDFCGGWICFVSALGMIGLLTAVIGDMANLLGCALDMKAPICAVTFVALGTSLPDTFASRTAAMQDRTADNSIGNVTGSNSVNVFLGLGMPWAIGAIYWSVKGAKNETGDPWYTRGKDMGWLDDYPEIAENFPDGAFVVPAGNLGLSVGVFSSCAVICIATLLLRRRLVGTELGGPRRIARATSVFFVFLWCVYIAMAIVAEGGVGPYT